ncbi:hypothetical protein [Barrientosiimonas humi]|uniref:hypothetical protein n=1 Tax=Barrientosiimonas humi TaxID=999931 RepID=UPI00370DBB6E
MSRRAWIALITVLALLAGFGVWRWSTSAAFRAERAADALADLAGVQSARTMERGGERHILAQLAPGASSDQTRAVISRASQLSADDVVRRVLVRVGSAEIYVGGYLPDDATETLLALAALPTGRATMISGSDVTVAPTDRTPLQTAIDSLRLVLDRKLRVDAVQVQGRNDDGKPYRQVRIEDPARSQLTMLQQLLPGQGQIRELEIGGEKRLEVEARTDRAGLAPVAQTVRRAATAADPVPRWVHVRTRGGEFQLNGSGDPAPALAAADDLERDGLSVDRISTDRAFVQVGGRWTGDRADLLPVAERAIRALDPPLPPGGVDLRERRVPRHPGRPAHRRPGHQPRAGERRVRGLAQRDVRVGAAVDAGHPPPAHRRAARGRVPRPRRRGARPRDDHRPLGRLARHRAGGVPRAVPPREPLHRRRPAIPHGRAGVDRRWEVREGRRGRRARSRRGRTSVERKRTRRLTIGPGSALEPSTPQRTSAGACVRPRGPPPNRAPHRTPRRTSASTCLRPTAPLSGPPPGRGRAPRPAASRPRRR